MDGNCLSCPNQQLSIPVFLGVGLLVVFCLWLQFFIVLRSGRSMIEAGTRHAKAGDHNREGFIVDEFESHEDGARHGSVITIYGAPPPKPNFTFKLKIALGFAQVVTNLAVALSLAWPDAFEGFVQSFNVLNFDIVQVTNVGCAFPGANYFDKLWFMCIAPIILIGAVALFYLLPQYMRNPVHKSESEFARKEARRNFWRLVMFSLFLVYPSVSSTVIRTFVCHQVEGEWYLVADFTVRCYTSEYNAWAAMAAIFTLIYPIGIPAFFFWMLWRYRDRLDEPGVRGQLGFLYDAYERDYWYFEMIDMGHKLFVTSLLAFFPTALQMSMGLLAVFLYLAIVLLARPYFRKSDDRLFILGQGELVLIMMAANVFYFNKASPALDAFMAFVLIAVFLTFFAYFLVQGVQAAMKIRNKHLRLRQRSQTIKGAIEMDGKDVGQIERKDVRVRHHKAIKGEDGVSERVRNPLWNMGDAALDNKNEAVTATVNPMSERSLAPGKKSSDSDNSTFAPNPLYVTDEATEEVETRPTRDSFLVRRDSAFDREEDD